MLKFGKLIPGNITDKNTTPSLIRFHTRLRGAPRNQFSLGSCLDSRSRPRDRAPCIAHLFTKRDQHTDGQQRPAAYAARAVNQHGFASAQSPGYVARERPESMPVIGHDAVRNLEW